jgi:hypothetical protein
MKRVSPTGTVTTIGSTSAIAGLSSLVEVSTGPGSILTGQITWGIGKASSSAAPYVLEMNTTTWDYRQLSITGTTNSLNWNSITSAQGYLFISDTTKVYKVDKGTGAATLVWTIPSGNITDIRVGNAGGTGVLFAATTTGLYRIL